MLKTTLFQLQTLLSQLRFKMGCRWIGKNGLLEKDPARGNALEEDLKFLGNKTS